MVTITAINIGFIVPMTKRVLLCGYKHRKPQVHREEWGRIQSAYSLPTMVTFTKIMLQVCLYSKYQPFCKDMSQAN